MDPVDFGFGMLTVDDPPECALPLMTVRFVKGPVSDAALARLFEAIEAVLQSMRTHPSTRPRPHCARTAAAR